MRRRGALFTVVGLLAALAAPSVAHAAVSSGFAYVWANQPGTASYDPPTPYSFNSTGAVNHIDRVGVGQYDVQFPNLGTSGGVSHATAYGVTTNTCQVGYRYWSGDTLWMRVYCFKESTLSDTLFTATFSNRPTTPNTAYLFANEPTSAAYTPNPTYQYNSGGGLSTVQRLGVGHYRIDVPTVPSLGDVQVSAYGATAARCSVGSFAAPGYPDFGRVIFVYCVNAANAPTDAYFMMTSAETGFLGRVPAAYARVDPPAPLSRTTPYSPTTSYNSTGAAITITRIGVGRSRVAMPGQPLTGGTVNVTGYSFGTERCNAVSWSTSGVTVQCWQGYTAYDSPFTVAFQS